MEGLTRLVSESMARHGFDRPLDFRRLHWSRWFRCESPHSLLFVPSKPGVFAVAEEIVHLTPTKPRVATDASAEAESRQPEVVSRRMLAVTQFFEDDDMAFVLDRMLSRQNPMQTRLISGRYFVRFVVIEDQAERHSICNALNQWMISATEKATGIGSHFATSLELTPATEYIAPSDEAQRPLFAGATGARVGTGTSPVQRREASAACSELGFSVSTSSVAAPQPELGAAAADTHRPSRFPSGF